MERRRISSFWVGQPLVDAIQILFLVVMEVCLWTILKDDAIGVFALSAIVTLISCYIGFHSRRIEMDDSNLYIGRLLRSGFVAVPFQQIQSIKLRRPLRTQIKIKFRKGSKAGSWVILIPPQSTIMMPGPNPDVVELIDRVADAWNEGNYIRTIHGIGPKAPEA